MASCADHAAGKRQLIFWLTFTLLSFAELPLARAVK
jgi:hypothetical protein